MTDVQSWGGSFLSAKNENDWRTTCTVNGVSDRLRSIDQPRKRQRDSTITYLFNQRNLPCNANPRNKLSSSFPLLQSASLLHQPRITKHRPLNNLDPPDHFASQSNVPSGLLGLCPKRLQVLLVRHLRRIDCLRMG